MRLTKQLKEKILVQFKGGATIAECATWYNQQACRIEGVIRDALNGPQPVKITYSESAPAGPIADHMGENLT
jgi:hypothetical protein